MPKDAIENEELPPTKDETSPKEGKWKSPVKNDKNCMSQNMDAPRTIKRRKRGSATRNKTVLVKRDFGSKTELTKEGVIVAPAVVS